MDLAADIQTVLEADDDLMDILTGGVHTDVEEINRQSTPDAFDANGEIQPCALIKLGNEFKISDTRRAVRTPITIYFYQRQGYDSTRPAMDLTHDLLNEQKIGDGVWNIEYDTTVYQQRDQALDCALETLRFTAARMR